MDRNFFFGSYILTAFSVRNYTVTVIKIFLFWKFLTLGSRDEDYP